MRAIKIIVSRCNLCLLIVQYCIIKIITEQKQQCKDSKISLANAAMLPYLKEIHIHMGCIWAEKNKNCMSVKYPAMQIYFLMCGLVKIAGPYI